MKSNAREKRGAEATATPEIRDSLSKGEKRERSIQLLLLTASLPLRWHPNSLPPSFPKSAPTGLPEKIPSSPTPRRSPTLSSSSPLFLLYSKFRPFLTNSLRFTSSSRKSISGSRGTPPMPIHCLLPRIFSVISDLPRYFL